MKVVLDEGVPEDLADYLPGHETRSVARLGWKGTTNGRLLKLLQSIDTEVFVTADKNLQRRQVLGSQPFGVLVLSTNNWPAMQEHVSAVSAALMECKPGVVAAVECGRFIPKRFRNL